MNPKAAVDTTKIPELIGTYQGLLKFVPGEKPYFLYTDRKKEMKDVQGMMEKVKELLENVRGLCVR